MRTEKLDPTFYAIIGTRRPDLLDHDDIKMVSEAYLASMEPAPVPLPNKRLTASEALAALNGNGAKKRRRRRGKRAKKVEA